jgi:hypothetical protein
MAVRLSVVMIHSPPPSASAGQMAEAIVGELIGLPEIDLTLIGPITQLAEGSTDRLTLESLSGDIAVLDWQSPQDLVDSLGAIGVGGCRAPHSDDPAAVAGSERTGRRIYAFDLNQYPDAQRLARSIVQLKASRQVRTFSLLPGPAVVPAHTADPAAPSRAEPPKPQPAAPPITPPHAASPPGEIPQPIAGTQHDRNRRQPAPNLDLDDLLNQLDELDP